MIYKPLLRRLKEESLKGIFGPDYVTGSNLPCHSNKRWNRAGRSEGEVGESLRGGGGGETVISM